MPVFLNGRRQEAPTLRESPPQRLDWWKAAAALALGLHLVRYLVEVL